MVYHIRCRSCGNLLYGGDNLFCGSGCGQNCTPERNRPPESMQVEKFTLSRTFKYKPSGRKGLWNLYILPRNA